MAGHSQFKNIMYRKGAQDKKRSKQFSRLSKEILVAVKESGSDPSANPRLRLAIQTARANNMPKDNIERAISKGANDDAQGLAEVRYEGYGPGGVAILVEALTDNRNRTVSSIRTVFSKNGGTLGEAGSVGFMFAHIGEIVYPLAVGNGEQMLEWAIEAGAQDVEMTEYEHVITCDFSDIGEVYDALKQTIGEALSVRTIWQPRVLAPVKEELAPTILKLISVLEDDDDVQNVYANFDIPEKVMENLRWNDEG